MNPLAGSILNRYLEKVPAQTSIDRTSTYPRIHLLKFLLTQGNTETNIYHINNTKAQKNTYSTIFQAKNVPNQRSMWSKIYSRIHLFNDSFSSELILYIQIEVLSDGSFDSHVGARSVFLSSIIVWYLDHLLKSFILTAHNLC